MSNIHYIKEETAANIGNFLVGRLLPFRQKRNIGPFVFIDHMGPAKLSEYQNLDVPPHPHIGLSTLTYLFEGAVMHRDSLGTEIEIKPGAVNWMTAGKGVVHSERTPEYLRTSEKYLHGLQIWIALPKELQETEPSFTHIDASGIPTWSQDHLEFKLIAGELFGHKSQVPVHSPLYMIEVKNNTQQTQTVDFKNQLFGESGLYILEGGVKSQDTEFGPKQILITMEAHLCAFELLPNSTVYIFGGEAFPEERFIFWNFVSTSRERIEKAKADWTAQNENFPKVPNETEWVPIPEPKLK